MNIFATHLCPIKSAQYLDDKRVVKMILESTQLLSTALILSKPDKITQFKIVRPIGKNKILYFLDGCQICSPTHVNHPCSKWVRNNMSNYIWLCYHLEGLLEEYSFRYAKIHKYQKLLDLFKNKYYFIPEGILTGFPNCTDLKYIKDIHKAYKIYLHKKWINDKRKPTWFNQWRNLDE